jgi:GNAT superfamily N-acetyltransferase
MPDEFSPMRDEAAGIGSVSIRCLAAQEARDCTEKLSAVLIDCVEGGASVSFMAPLSREKADGFWRHVAEGVETGERILLVAEDRATGEFLGTVQLVFGLPENQPHRGDVAKMLVRRSARRRGLAGHLMRAVEEEARNAGKTLLVLDTVTGGDAERLYTRMGWTKTGVVPNYALMPDGRPCDTTIFYKALSDVSK